MKKRKIVAMVGMGALGLALIGAGAGATFTTSTTSTQKITAGTIGMSVWAPGTSCPDASYKCGAITLPDVGPVGSTFETPATHVYVTNTGNIPAYFSAIQMSSTDANSAADAALRNAMDVCIHSQDPSGTWVEGNGPLTVADALNPTVVENPVKVEPGQTVSYWVSFYAGQDSACGAEYSDGPHTSANWAGYLGHPYQTPASLPQQAQGGSVTPTLTFSYTG
jgi:hypothetical protein